MTETRNEALSLILFLDKFFPLFLSQTMTNIPTLFLFSLLLSPILIQANNCNCETSQYEHQNKQESLKYKLVAIASILVASFIGICTPMLLKNTSYLQPNSAPHFLIKSYSAGVILATAFLHILPDAFESLSSPCLSQNPWGEFPFAGFVAMMTALATLMMESFATGYHKRAELAKSQPLDCDDTNGTDDVETAGPGHVHGPAASIMLHKSELSDSIRNQIVAQVLELGIVVHSVVIGISLGATQSPKTIKPLIAALSFHQFFEGMGLGTCISQAKFKSKSIIVMILFFSLTTPTGIAIGIGISNVYNEQSPTALIVEGILDSSSAGILIYMALVDLLAADFMNPILQTNFKLQIWTNFALLMGASCMAVLARWG